MNSDRLACITVPEFPLRVLVDTPGMLERIPCAVAVSDEASASIITCNRRAQSHLVPGMTTARAKSRLPDLRLFTRDTDREKTITAAILNLLQHVGPYVEESEPGQFFLQVTGLTRLYKSELGVIQSIFKEVAATPYPVLIGIAGNKLIGRIASLSADNNRYTIVPPSSEGTFLSPLPISVLPVSIETKDKLYRLGLRTVGELARFPANEITRRFGDDIRLLAHYVRGIDPHRLVPEKSTDDISTAVDFDFPISSNMVLTKHISHGLQPVLLSLQNEGRGCRAVELTLCFADRSEEKSLFRLESPTASPAVWMRQIQCKPENRRAGGGIRGIRLTVQSVEAVLSHQLSLPEISGQGKACPVEDIALTGLPHAFRVGFRPRLLPEARYRLAPLPTGKSEPATSSDTDQPCYVREAVTGLRVYPPGNPVDVSVSSGRIVTARLNGRLQNIRKYAGPWHLSGEWWNGSFDRYYYEVETEDNELVLVYYDMPGAQWILQGVFD